MDYQTTNLLPDRNTDGQLPAYAWPGGYPITYLTAKDEVLCPACASKDRTDDFPGPAVLGDVVWEGEPLTCEDCQADIETAYGPVEAEETANA